MRSAALVVAVMLLTAPALRARSGDPQLPTDRSIRVGVLATHSEASKIVDRLKRHGFDVLALKASELGQARVDVLYLPSGWYQERADVAAVDAQAKAVHGFVAGGGGLVVVQPNPYLQPEETGTPRLLPLPVTFYNRYGSEKPAVVERHLLTDDLSVPELPYCADRILAYDPGYRVLVRTPIEKTPCWMVASFKQGRIVVNAGNDSQQTDEVLTRQIFWAAGANDLSEVRASSE